MGNKSNTFRLEISLMLSTCVPPQGHPGASPSCTTRGVLSWKVHLRHKDGIHFVLAIMHIIRILVLSPESWPWVCNLGGIHRRVQKLCRRVKWRRKPGSSMDTTQLASSTQLKRERNWSRGWSRCIDISYTYIPSLLSWSNC